MASLEQEKAKTLALLKKGYTSKSYEDISKGYKRAMPVAEPVMAPAPVPEWSKTTPAEDFLNLPLVRGTFNTLSAPIGAIKNTLVGALNPEATGTNTAEQFAAGASDFYKEHPIASIGTLGLGNVIGGLSNVGQQAKTGEDVVKASYAAGLRLRGIDAPTANRMAEDMAKEHSGLVGAAGLTFDITADPINFITGGESAVAKSLARGAQDEALRIAQQAGIKTTRKEAVQNVPEQIYKQTIDRYKGNETLGQLPVLQKGTQQAEDRIAKLAEINRSKAASQIEAKAKEAARRTQNSILSLNVPFSNKVKDIGNKANIPVVGKYLTKTPDLLGAQNAYLVRKMFENIEPSVKNVYTKDASGAVQATKEITATPEQRMMNFLKQRYKINSLDEMTVDMFRDLQEAFKGVSPSKLPLIKTSYKPSMQPIKETVRTETPFNINEILKTASPEVQTIVQGLVRQGSTAEDIIRDLPAILREEAKSRKVPTPVVSQAAPVIKELTHDEKVKSFISDLNKYINTPEGKANISPKASSILVNLAKNKNQQGLDVALKEFELLKQPKTANVPEVKIEPPVQKPAVEFKLPTELAKSKPRYGYGQKLFNLSFDSDLDKALFIVAQSKKSKAHDKFLSALTGYTGLGEKELQSLGQQVRGNIKALAKDSSAGSLTIPNSNVLAKEVTDPESVAKVAAKEENLPKQEIPTPAEKDKEIEVLNKTAPTPEQAQVIRSLDAETVKQLRSIAKKIETSKPVTVTTKKQLVKDANGKLVMEDVGGTTKVLRKQENAVIDPFQILKKAPDFHQAANARSNISRAIKLNWFGSQLINSGNDFIDSYTRLIRDARTQVEGEARYLQRDLQKIKDMAQNMSAEDMLHVQYAVESRFPKHFTDEQKNMILDNPNIKQAAETITNLMKYVGKEDLASGMIKKLRKDYFPHVLDISDKQWEVFKRKYASDPDLKGLIGVSQKGAHQKERKGFPTLAQVDDAIYTKQQRLEGLQEGSEIYNKTKEQLDALQGLFKRDTLDAVNSHIKRSVRARVMSDLYKQMKHDGLLYDSKPIHNADQYVQVTNDEMANALGVKLHSWIHSDVLNGLRKSEKVFSSEGMNKFMKTFEEVMRIWRLGTYQLLPKHHVNNLIGNLFNSGMIGITPKSYKNAMDLLEKHKKNPDKLTSAEQELIMNAYKDGIIGQGYGAEFRPFEKDHKSFLAKTSNWLQSNAYGKTIMTMGEAIDDWSRLALYIHGLSAFGGTRKTAAELVRKYLFNYHEMTQADKYIRSAVPFWLWMKNNIPLQIEQLIKNPKYLMTAEKIRQWTFDDKQDMQNQPEYIRDGYFNLFGSQYKLPLPMYDLNMINGVAGTSKAVMGTLNPFIQMIPELATNESLLTGAPIQKEMEKRRNPQQGYDIPTLAGYVGGKVGGFPAWAIKDIAKNKDNLSGLEEAWRIAQSYGFGSPAVQK